MIDLREETVQLRSQITALDAGYKMLETERDGFRQRIKGTEVVFAAVGAQKSDLKAEMTRLEADKSTTTSDRENLK